MMKQSRTIQIVAFGAMSLGVVWILRAHLALKSTSAHSSHISRHRWSDRAFRYQDLVSENNTSSWNGRSTTVYQSAAIAHRSSRIPLRSESKTCDLQMFKNALPSTNGSNPDPRLHLANCTAVLYNRVPKCASRTNRDTFIALAKRSGQFSVVYIDGPYTLPPNRLKIYEEEISKLNGKPFVLVSHFYFSDITRLFPQKAIYINMVRDPSEWFISFYNAYRYDSKTSPLRFNKSTTDCVEDEACFRYFHELSGPLKFLCGQFESCSNNAATVQRVKRNIKQYYLLIAPYKNISEFHQMLEILLPHVFTNLSHTYHSTAPAAHSYTRTRRKDILSPSSRDLLKEKLRYDYEVYNFIKQTFYDLVKSVQQFSTYHATTSKLYTSV